ncbi:hypothetical protein MNBD_PLANCTO03-276 [hydrothermal vent metagenome]|uniref:DUF2231 domain-containing protein n=1 Tax=hydrothermal vent metagenome TaxID=652676 RepID=A0A3B1DXH0_9ZZZZ
MTRSHLYGTLRLMIPAFLFALVWGGGLARGQDIAAPAEITNQICPVTTDEEIDPEFFVETDEGRLYFCCAKCRRRYERDPAKYAEGLAEVMPARFQPESEPEEAHADDHAHDEQPAQPTADDHDAEDDGHDHNATQNADDHNEDEGEHDHGDHGSGDGFLAKLLGWFGNFHPPSTHFPVAMLFGAALGEAAFLFTRRSFFAAGARFCLWFAIPGAVAAAVLGWFYAGLALTDGDWIMTTHRWLGTATALLAVAVLGAGWGRVVRGEGDASRMYLVLLGLAAGAVGLNGFLGGALVYGLDHYAF